jgi:hypothetical protein
MKSLISLLLFFPGDVSSFVTTSHHISSSSVVEKPTFLLAKKKRRRRKENPASSTTSPPSFDDDDELPDFDLVEDIDLIEQAAASLPPINAGAPKAGVAPAANRNFDVNDPSVVAAQRATSGADSLSAGSTRELLRSRNRDLENRLVVNEVTEAVPSLGEYMQSPTRSQSKGATESGGPSIGKKAARREARRAAAIEARQDDLVEQSALDQILEKAPILEKLPFFKKKENEEKKSAIKLLEEGTWACIYILVAWEFYINTPFFNRAGPMAPVVFTDPMTMTFLI